MALLAQTASARVATTAALDATCLRCPALPPTTIVLCPVPLLALRPARPPCLLLACQILIPLLIPLLARLPAQVLFPLPSIHASLLPSAEITTVTANPATFPCPPLAMSLPHLLVQV